MFFPMDKPAEEPYGDKSDSKYQDQRGPTESRLDEDPDA
jgi:deoxycytidine triphosphate deaminase